MLHFRQYILTNLLLYIHKLVFGFLLGCSLIVGQQVQAQDSSDKKFGDKLVKDAEQFYAEMKYEDAKEAYQIAGDWYRKNGYPELYAICYNGIGNIFIDLTKFNKAKYEGFQKALDLLDERKAIDSTLTIDSSLVADAYEGYGRYYMNVAVASQDSTDADERVRFDTAMTYFRSALDIRKGIYGEKHPEVAQSYYFIGRCYRGFPIISDSSTIDSLAQLGIQVENPIEKELDYLNKALDIQLSQLGEQHYQVANTYEALGDYYYEVQKDYQTGFDYHKKALAIRQDIFDANHPQIASSYVGLATYYRVMNLFDQELEYLEKALTIQLKTLGNENKAIAENYYRLGNRYRRSGDYEKALSYYQQALNIFIKLQNKNSVEVADVYFVMSLCYKAQEDARKAKAYLRKAKRIRELIFGKKHFSIAEIYMELGDHFANQYYYDSTLVFYQKATKLWETQLGDHPYFLSKAYDKLAYAYRLQRNTEKEFEYLNKSLNLRLNGTVEANLDINTKQFGSMAADLDFSTKEEEETVLGYQLYDSYLNLAYFYKRKEDYRLALTYAHKALAAVCKSLKNKSDEIFENPTIQELSHNIAWLEALQQKGDLSYQVYQTEQKSELLDFSLQTYQDALELVDTLRINFTSDGAKQLLTKRAIPVYEGAIRTLYKFYVQNQDPQYLNKAFEVMEGSKAFVLLQALQTVEATGFGEVSLELLAKEARLRRNLAFYSNYKNRTEENQKEFDQAYFETKQAYDSLINQIEQEYPRYYKLKYKSSLASVQKVQAQLLNSNKVLIEYFVGDKHIYIFTISKDQAQLKQMRVPQELMRLIQSFRHNLTDYQLIGKKPVLAYQNLITYARNIHKLFLEPFIQDIAPSVNELIIIPDGLLNYIPFEVLLLSDAPQAETPNYAALEFLIKRYKISYNYSSTLLLENKNRRWRSNNGRCIGFAPSYENTLSSELPWAEKELKAVESSFNGQYYYGLDATKKIFVQDADNYAVIHLAMHGVVNMRSPLNSKLAFALPEKAENIQESFLYAHEVHEMNLNAELVVLSACETGLGKVIRGEGVLSLARAFMYAGTPSVVTTLWKVNDFASASLMNLFYANLAQGMPKHEALRQAKLQFLLQSDQISGHPAFWGSFTAIGDTSPISRGWAWWAWVLLVLTVGGLGWLGYRWWQNRKAATSTDSGTTDIETIQDEELARKASSTPTINKEDLDLDN